MLDGLDLDPHVVLGVAEGCSAVELRDAYHRKSKKHHPDQGGDDWAFKVVVRAYEALQKLVPRERLIASAREAPDTGRIRPGVHDRGTAPERLVHVEMVWMRYEVGDLLALMADKGEDRNLSGSLEVNWPGDDVPEGTVSPELGDRILKALNASFDELRARSHPTAARSEIDKAGSGPPSATSAANPPTRPSSSSTSASRPAASASSNGPATSPSHGIDRATHGRNREDSRVQIPDSRVQSPESRFGTVEQSSMPCLRPSRRHPPRSTLFRSLLSNLESGIWNLESGLWNPPPSTSPCPSTTSRARTGL